MALTEKGKKLWEELYPPEENKKSWERIEKIAYSIRKGKCKG